ncbi:uncharacterized protein LOC106098362 [Oreochromis niloticus]|nr:uncharacterized protein LOC106098362 [Oreochromis niloticus]
MDLIAKALQTAFWFFVNGERDEGVDRAGINNLLSASTSQQLQGLLLFSQQATSMEMMMFVLVSAVAMLINPYAANPVPNNNLNRIIDLAEKYNKDLNERFFVDDVSYLADSGCGNNFFCKVNDILQKHAKNENEKDIVRNLGIFIKESNMNCKEVLKKVGPSEKEQPLPDLLGNLTKCIQRRNFMGNVTQAAWTREHVSQLKSSQTSFLNMKTSQQTCQLTSEQQNHFKGFCLKTRLLEVFSQQTTSVEMTMLVLVSAVAMLISPCAANPVRNLTLSDSLNSIIDIVEEYNENLTKSFYVEDVTYLVESGCGNNFFCKVHDILQKHPKNGNEKDIVRNLEIFIKKSDMNCKEVLKKVQPSEKEQPLPDLLGNLTKCIQRRNFMGNVAQAA